MDEANQRAQRRSGKVEVTTRMRPELADALRERAASRGRTITDYVVGLIEADLNGGQVARTLAVDVLLDAIHDVRKQLETEAARDQEVFAQAS